MTVFVWFGCCLWETPINQSVIMALKLRQRYVMPSSICVGNPELKVTKCKIHRNSDVDLKLERLHRNLEVRLSHVGCSKENCSKNRNELLINKIIKLKRCNSNTQKYYEFIEGEEKQANQASCLCENCDRSSISSRFTSLSSCNSHSSSCCYDLIQDTLDIEQIRYARKSLIKQRFEILNDPEKIRLLDFPKIRHCLRQYKIMQKIDYHIYDLK